MKKTKVCLAAVAVLALCATALASPVINGALINPRIWNDCPTSTFTSGNTYPSSLWMNDTNVNSGNYANRHNFRLSENGGATEAVYLNGDAFSFAADVTITGSANVEGGLNLSPWWSQEVDGVMMLNTETGEVSCWGGRLPFYSFTVNNGITYTKGETVRLGMTYDPHSLSAADPATIVYTYEIGGTTYSSGVLPFDQGNPAEDPPYGLWGMLNDARVGGYFMPKVNTADPGNWGEIHFDNMVYTPEPASIVLLGLAGLLAARKR